MTAYSYSFVTLASFCIEIVYTAIMIPVSVLSGIPYMTSSEFFPMVLGSVLRNSETIQADE